MLYRGVFVRYDAESPTVEVYADDFAGKPSAIYEKVADAPLWIKTERAVHDHMEYQNISDVPDTDPLYHTLNALASFGTLVHMAHASPEAFTYGTGAEVRRAGTDGEPTEQSVATGAAGVLR